MTTPRKRPRASARTTAVAAATLTALSAALGAAAAYDNDAHHATRDAVLAAVDDGVPGITLTAHDLHGPWSTTAGVADLRTGQPRTPADRYRVGSITKTFVATVVLQLAAEQRLTLDDPVDRWLPGVLHGNGNDGRLITVRQLLNHTSGLHDYTQDPDFARAHLTEPGFREHRYDTHAPPDLVTIALRHEPAFPPGDDWSYSNTNYVVAGMVIEAVTGRPYDAEVRARIIEPLHLTATSVPGTRTGIPRPSARAYSKLSETSTTGPTHDVTRFNPSIAGAAGEMISNSTDLNRFYTALLGGKLLPPEQLKAMKTTVPVNAPTDDARYGLGLIARELSCGVRIWGHAGGIYGSLTEAATTPDGTHTVAFNLNGDWTGDTGAILEAEFCGTED
ncbi:serine hydrolase domain-containing protein [Streptomyces broussonetiae]|uniref:Serine hydrolase domain-containing protein n=1 Tax=Streptomyces broussonetiae TaxID=2686304 RepID=A0ABV5ELR2_9ACTN